MADKEAFTIATFRSPFIGDDGAVVGNAVYSMDAFIEGTHFLRSWMTPAQIGRKAMLVNISDAVAMNAEPRYALVTLGLPQEMSEAEIEELTGAMQRTAKAFGCEIIGGDTVKSDVLHISVALISHSDAPLLRTGLKEGDMLAFTGTLGESKRHLEALFRGEKIPETSRFYTPTLRGEFIAQARPFLRAGMDISDGLFCDTNKLLDLNDTGVTLLHHIDNETGLSGEEYEMLIAFAPQHKTHIYQIAKKTHTPLTVFARITRNGFRLPCKGHHFS